MTPTPPMRRYTSDELAALLETLRQVVAPHHSTVAVLLTMALLLELTHGVLMTSSPEEWMTEVVPVLHRELLRGTAAVLSATVMAIDESGQDRVH